MQSAGLRAFVGKLSMDIDITSPNSLIKTYTEKSASESLAASRAFVQRCREIAANLPEFHRLVEPVLTPRFVPTCTDELLAGLGEISESDKIKIQSHLAEAKDQVEWVRAERGIEDIDVFEKVIYVLLTSVYQWLMVILLFFQGQSPYPANCTSTLYIPEWPGTRSAVDKGDICGSLSSF